MQTRIIKGHPVTDSGALGFPTPLTVEVTGTGIAFDPMTGEELTAQQEAQGGGIVADIISNGVWTFYAAPGECERAGIVVLSTADQRA